MNLRVRSENNSIAWVLGAICLVAVLAAYVTPHSAIHAQATCTGTLLAKSCPENTDTMTVVTSTDETVSSIVLSGGDRDQLVLETDPPVQEGFRQKVAARIFFRLPPDFENPLDADGNNVYQTTISASDGVTTNEFAFAATVTNVEEDGAITFSSRQPEQGTPFTATLNDSDGGISGETWLWEKSADGSTNWSTTSSVTTNVYTPVAADLNNYLRASVTYSDALGSGKTAQERSEHEVHEKHPDNHSPEFPSTETGIRNIDEDSPPGTDIGAPVAALDDEHAGVLIYDLGGPDADSFDFNRTTGQLMTKAELDFEEKNTYNVTVTVTVTDPSLVSVDQAVIIRLNNVEEPGTLTMSTPRPREGERLRCHAGGPRRRHNR